MREVKHAVELKQDLRKRFSDTEVRLLFTARTHDHLFAWVGKCLGAKDDNKAIWLGMEYLATSPYLPLHIEI